MNSIFQKLKNIVNSFTINSTTDTIENSSDSEFFSSEKLQEEITGENTGENQTESYYSTDPLSETHHDIPETAPSNTSEIAFDDTSEMIPNDMPKTTSCDISELSSDDIFDILPDCVITDIETTGLIYNKNSIIEIAAIKIIDGKISDTYSSFIHRDKPLNSKTTALTGITTSMLRECPKDLATVMFEYEHFIGDLPLVGHNILSFDIKFINEAYLKVFGQSISNKCIDTLKLSYEHFFEVESHKLNNLAEYANISTGTAHRALGDCETTLHLYKYMMCNAGSMLLKWSKKGKDTDVTNTNYPKYVTRKYPPESCYIFHQKLISSGYLIRSDVENTLSSFTKPMLLNILRSNDLPVGGNKSALITCIMENVNIQSLDLPTLYIPSKKGTTYLGKYLTP